MPLTVSVSFAVSLNSTISSTKSLSSLPSALTSTLIVAFSICTANPHQQGFLHSLGPGPCLPCAPV
eukprot:8750101-Heterocapsa_arctica.AAC.1